MTLVELRQKKGNLWQQAQEIHKRAEQENRAMSEDENAQWEKINKEIDTTNDRIAKEERSLQMDRELASLQADNERASKKQEDDKPIEYRGAFIERTKLSGREYRTAFTYYLKHGRNSLGGEETRALTQGVGTQGGYLVMPQEMMPGILMAMDNVTFMRSPGFANILPPLMKAASLGIPSMDSDVDDADWTTELATGSEDTGLAFSKRELFPHPLAKRIKPSKTLVRNASLDIVNFILGRLGYKVGITQEKAYMTGTGNQRPLGVFTASADGISTARDVSTDNTTTSPTADGLLNAKFAIKQQYWPRLRWIFHRDGVLKIRKLKDGDGNYLWLPGLTGGVPDRILEVPYAMSEYAPNTFTTGLYVGIIGDFSQYWIVDALTMEMQQLDELYAETNQVGFIIRYEGDGMPVLEEAFARVKLA